jgi:two-component system, OmpR family, phosphate regulon response regulator PhoB
MAARILVIEDDTALVTLLDYNLNAEGYEVTTAPSAEDGKLLLAEQQFDLIILDWMLPDMSGIELCAELRRKAKAPPLPILMLTARGEEADRVRGLSTGADDYVVKPFSVPELMARVTALLRRAAPERISDVLSVGDITMDRGAHRVARGTRTIELGPTEYRLLEVLLESAGRVLSRQQLIDRVWSNTAEIDERTIDVHVGRLRKALVRGTDADPIRTVRGAGYALDVS